MYNLRSALVAFVSMLVVIMMMATHVSARQGSAVIVSGSCGNTDNVHLHV